MLWRIATDSYRLTFVQIAADEYVDVREVGLGQHVQRMGREKHAVHGGRGREAQDAGVAVPLFLGYDARVDGPQTRHGADGVGGQPGRVALAVVQQLLAYVDGPFARHVAPRRVHRAGLYDAALHHSFGHRRDEVHAHLERTADRDFFFVCFFIYFFSSLNKINSPCAGEISAEDGLCMRYRK